jgi:hypothetical protein
MSCGGGLTSMAMTVATSFVGADVPGLSDLPISADTGFTDAISSAASSSELGGTLENTVSSMESSSISIDTLSSDFSSSLKDLSGTLKDTANTVVGFTSDMKQAWNGLQTDLSSSFSSLTGGIGANAFASLESTAFNKITQTATRYASSWASQTIGGPAGALIGGIVGNPAKLGSILSSASSYAGQANNMINSATNANENYLGGTTNYLDNTTTGGLDGVTKYTSGLGADMSNVGNAINLSNISSLGSPGQLLQNISNSGSIGSLFNQVANLSVNSSTLTQLGVNAEKALLNSVVSGQPLTLASAGVNINSLIGMGSNMPSSIQNQLYGVFANTTGSSLSQVQTILGNKTSGLTSAADLLNPAKLLPTSWQTLTVPIKTASMGHVPIYADDTGAVNPDVAHLGEHLVGIIPDDLAAANGALARSLGQIKNIQQITPQQLGDVASSIENNKGLPDIQAQTSATPPGVAEYWYGQYGKQGNIDLATGPGGTMLLHDLMGIASGHNSTEPINGITAIHQKLESAGALDPLTKDDGPNSKNTGIHKVIQYFASGTYGPTAVINTDSGSGDTSITWTVTIPGTPLEGNPLGPVKGHGVYTGGTAQDAFSNAWHNGIIPELKNIVQDIATAYPDEAAQSNALTDQLGHQLAREYINHSRAQNTSGTLDLTATPASHSTAIQFATSLHSYGTDTTDGGAAQVLEALANKNTLGGQAMIATMREGRNLQKLQNAGLIQDSQLNNANIPTQAPLLSGQYSVDEALAAIKQPLVG